MAYWKPGEGHLAELRLMVRSDAKVLLEHMSKTSGTWRGGARRTSTK